MLKLTKHPYTRKWEKADWRFNWHKEMIVEFPDKTIFYAKDWSLPTKTIRYGKPR